MKFLIALTLFALVAVATSTVLLNSGLSTGLYHYPATYGYGLNSAIYGARYTNWPSVYGSQVYSAGYAAVPTTRYYSGYSGYPLVYDWLKK